MDSLDARGKTAVITEYLVLTEGAGVYVLFGSWLVPDAGFSGLTRCSLTPVHRGPSLTPASCERHTSSGLLTRNSC